MCDSRIAGFKNDEDSNKSMNMMDTQLSLTNSTKKTVIQVLMKSKDYVELHES